MLLAPATPPEAQVGDGLPSLGRFLLHQFLIRTAWFLCKEFISPCPYLLDRPRGLRERWKLKSSGATEGSTFSP
jgi:hypothetical protein